MSSSLREKTAVFLILAQIFFAFCILAVAKQQTALFYISVFGSIINIFILYFIYNFLKIKDVEILELENQSGVDMNQEQTEKVETSKQEENIISLVKKYQELIKFEKREEAVLSVLAQSFQMVQGVVYTKKTNMEFHPEALYAWFREDKPASFIEGETLPGQVAANRKTLYLSTIPESYVSVYSGLGNSTPRYILFVPVITDAAVNSIVEAAFFKALDNERVELINKWINEIARFHKSVN